MDTSSAVDSAGASSSSASAAPAAAAPSAAASSPAPGGRFKHFLIVNNVQKAKNIRNMLVSASAFGVTEVFVVGQKKFDVADHAGLVQALSCPVTRLPSLADCRALCQARGIRIVGVEILETARSISENPFQGDTAFIMGNEVGGLKLSRR